MMYREHWGLREAPFRPSLDARFFYQTPGTDEALARLHFLVDEHRRLGLCVGAAGSGKSMLLEVLARQLRRQGRQVVFAGLLGVELHEWLWLIAADLGGAPDRHDSELCLWRTIADRIAENRQHRIDTVVLLDDADETEPPVVDAVARLAECDQRAQSRLTIVASAKSDSLRQLGSRMIELADLRIELETWEQADTVGFVLHSLRQAGRRDPLFTDEAMVRLHELCEGVPRRITQLAHLSLLAGAGERASRIDADTVESAFHELAAVA